jgi:hypothetical protein
MKPIIGSMLQYLHGQVVSSSEEFGPVTQLSWSCRYLTHLGFVHTRRAATKDLIR